MGYYNQEIEKIATRRWKRDIGSLSDANYNRLVSSGVLNHKTESDGLNEGSANILKRYNGIFDTDGSLTENKLLSTYGGKDFSLHDTYKIKNGKNGFIMSSNNTGFEDARRALRNATRASAEKELDSMGYTSIVPDNPNEKAVVRIGSWTKDISPEREKELINSFEPHERSRVEQDFKNLRHNKRNIRQNATQADKAYLEALSKRHEVDEVRTKRLGRKYNKAKKYFTHNSPEVLFRESVNMAGTTPRVKGEFGNIRRSTGEIENMANNGLKYTKKGTLNKSKMKKFVRRASKSVLPKTETKIKVTPMSALSKLKEIIADYKIE